MTDINPIIPLVDEVLEGTDIFPVDIRISPKNEISISLDGEKGLPIGIIGQINRDLYKKIEASELFPEGDFSLEVGSPGADTPLKFKRQYYKHIGRNLSVDLEDEKNVVGKLLSVSADGIELEETINKKKKEKVLHTIDFKDIKKAIVQISF